MKAVRVFAAGALLFLGTALPAGTTASSTDQKSVQASFQAVLDGMVAG